jgi:cytochrome P450
MADVAEVVRTPRVPGHPVLGHLGTFRKSRTSLQLRIARDYPDIASLRFGLVRSFMVSSPALAHEILATKQECFVKAPGLSIFLKPVLGNGLLTSERDFHASQRKLIAPAFAHKRIASYAETMAARAWRYASALAPGDHVDVSEDMMRLTLEIVGKTLFDAEVAGDADLVGDALTETMKTAMSQLESLVPLPPMVPTPTNMKNRRAVAKLDAIVYRIIRERRAQGGDRGDLLSMLLEAQHEDGGRMTDRQVRDESMTLFLAGHETTANALAWTLYLLARNPDARARLEAEVDALGRTPTYDDLKLLPYTLAVLKESMRLYPPAYILARRAVETTTIGGHRIPRNAITLINVLGIHRRPDTFDAPDAFRPERFVGDAEKHLPRCAYMPFGAGPRICIGNHFALMEGHVLLATMLRRVRFDLVSPERDVEVEPLVTLRPKGGVAMRVSLRGPAAAEKFSA